MKRPLILFVLIFCVAFIRAQEICPEFQKDGVFETLTEEVFVLSHLREGVNYAYNVKAYQLDLSIEPGSKRIQGSGKIIFSSEKKNLTNLTFDIHHLFEIDSILSPESKKLEFSRNNDFCTVTIVPCKLNEISFIKVYYRGEASEIQGRGIVSYNSPIYGKATYSSTEPWFANEFFPVKQDLADKADSVKIAISVPKGYKVGSQGLLKEVKQDGDRDVFIWESHYPIAYYLISFAAAKFDEYEYYVSITDKDKNEKNVLFQNYFPDNYDLISKNKAKKHLEELSTVFQFFSERFCPYPFSDEKYGHCCVLGSGAMENQTMTTTTNIGFQRMNIHELGHSWFGNLVTCATWNDLWLNEGFTTYTEYLAFEYLNDEAKILDWWQATKKWGDYFDKSIYCPDEDMTYDRLFSGLTYNKGARVMHMIRLTLNDDYKFFEVLKSYLQRFENKVAATKDFKIVLEEISNMNWDNFFDAYVYKAKTVKAFLNCRKTKDGKLVIKSKFDPDIPFFPIRLYLNVRGNNKTQEISFYQEKEDQEFVFEDMDYVEEIANDDLLKSLIIPEISFNSYSVAENELEVGVSCYPNPVEDVVLVNLSGAEEKCVEIEVTDLSGRILKRVSGECSSFQISVKDLSSSVYFMKLNVEGKSIVKKIIVR
ncbi:MAG: M1 family aminopeptidase [Bacteroidales bacterium]